MSQTTLEAKLPEIITRVGYDELYGLHFNAELGPAHHEILSKFLKANNNDLGLAATQLENTLKWRSEFKPLNTLNEEHGDLNKLAVLTESPSGKVVTWNLYGAARTVKERQELFGDLEKFLRWRVSVMERGIRLMDFSDSEKCYMDQIHDYNGVSFLRLDSTTKKASGATIKLFQDYYPEFLSAKYFVNVPTIMTWMFGFARMFMSQATADKFHVVGDGKELAFVLGNWIPAAYGGKAESLEAIRATESEAPVEEASVKEKKSENGPKADAFNLVIDNDLPAA